MYVYIYIYIDFCYFGYLFFLRKMVMYFKLLPTVGGCVVTFADRCLCLCLCLCLSVSVCACVCVYLLCVSMA